MKLGVFERLILLNIMPHEGDITTLRIVRDLQGALSFSEAEHSALQFDQDGGRMQWKAEADNPKEVPVGAKAQALIAETLEKLSADGKLTMEHLPLYERFCEAD